MLDNYTTKQLRKLRKKASVNRALAKSEYRAENIRKAYYYQRLADKYTRFSYMLLWNSTEGYLN